MTKRSNSSTNQAVRTTGERKKEKPARLTLEEKFEKYGDKNNPTGYKLKFEPLTDKQKEYYNLILNKRITFGTGVAGSGKSFVCLAAALKLLREDNQYKKILILTPTVEAGNMNIGFLKGTKDEKILPYLEADYSTIQDILDMSGNEHNFNVNNLIEGGFVKGECVNFMRGKTIKNTIVIITEAENFNKQEMWLLLSRISPTSKYIINGDNRQQDRKDIKKDVNNGLKHAMNTLKDKLDSIGFCHFTKEDIVRDPIIEEIMDLWFEGEERNDEY